MSPLDWSFFVVSDRASPLIAFGGSITAEGEELPLMPFTEKTGVGLNDREDPVGREVQTTRAKITVSIVLRIVVVDDWLCIGSETLRCEEHD